MHRPRERAVPPPRQKASSAARSTRLVPRWARSEGISRRAAHSACSACSRRQKANTESWACPVASSAAWRMTRTIDRQVLLEARVRVLGEPLRRQSFGRETGACRAVDRPMQQNEYVRQLGHGGDSVAERKAGAHPAGAKGDRIDSERHRRATGSALRGGRVSGRSSRRTMPRFHPAPVPGRGSRSRSAGAAAAPGPPPGRRPSAGPRRAGSRG